MIGRSVLQFWVLALSLGLQIGSLLSESRRPNIFTSLEEILSQDERPVLLVFFSTSCSTCWDDLLEMRLFLHERGLSVRLVGITGDRREEVERFCRKYSFFEPIVLDQRRKIFKAYQVDLVPFKVILLRRKIVYKDDYYLEFGLRKEEAKRCLAAIGRG